MIRSRAIRLVAVAAVTAVALPAWIARGVTPVSCPAPQENVTPTVITGTFGPGVEGAYVLVPFDVPDGTTRVRVKLCYDLPESYVSQAPSDVPQAKHTLDLGLYHAREASGFWDENEFRGWGGSSRLNAFVGPEGATPGFKPGSIPSGEWAAEIGVAAVVGPEEGDLDGVAWRMEIYLSSDPPVGTWLPTAYEDDPIASGPAWYKGDFHVHATHSGSRSMCGPINAPLAGTFNFAFTPTTAGGAGLDFITLSDYVTDRHWDEIAAQPCLPPDKLVVRSTEVITYRGHVNNHASLTFVDYRTGPIFKREGDGSPTELRAAGWRTAKDIFDDVHAGGGWTQVNHPTTFPSKVPLFANICRGCSWEYSDEETDWSKVDAMEVQTGPAGYTQPKGNEPGPNPFTPLAIEWWDRLRRAGHDITAVGSSDSHRAGDEALTYSPIGEATTVVYAQELSETGIRDGVLAGRAYIKFFSSDGPELGLTAEPLGGGDDVMMGDQLNAAAGAFTATVKDAAPRVANPPSQPRVLVVMLNGAPYLSVPVPDGDFTFDFIGVVPGDYRLQLQRGTAIEALTNPITLCPAGVLIPICTG